MHFLPEIPLSSVIEQRITHIYDHLYANAPVRTPQRIAYEVGKILRTAMCLEAEKKGVPAFDFSRADRRQIESGQSLFIKQIADDVQTAFTRMNKKWHLYPPGDHIELSDFDIVYSCSMLSGVLVSDPRRDVFGDALEIFRSEWAKKHGGQFFTDQRVTRLAMALLQFDPRRGDDLVDICAGTGGFLLAGLNHVRSLLGTDDSEGSETKIVQLALKSLRGQEIDEDIRSIANATLASRLGDGSRIFVQRGDSLRSPGFSNRNRKIQFDSHLCAATNPPFGTKITVKDPTILRHFELTRLSNAKRRGQVVLSRRLSPRSPDVLFLEQNIRLLKPGKGRLAIVMPYQIASGPQAFFIRKWLLRNVELLAVIDLPPETFQPHTGTKACLVVLKRRDRPLPKVDTSRDQPIFMAIPRWIGHDRRGNPVYKRLPTGTLSAEILTDFHDVESSFHLMLRGKNPAEAHPNAFTVENSRISQDPELRINALFHRPIHVPLTKSHSATKHTKKWKAVKLRDVVQAVFFPGRFKRNYVDRREDAIPFLGGTNISQLIVNTDKYLAPDDPRLAELRVRPGWILVTRSGSTGVVARVPGVWDGFAISEHVIRIVPEPSKLPGEYLYAFLCTTFAQEALARGVYGSVIDEISPEFVGNLDVLIPANRESIERIIHLIDAGEHARQQAVSQLTEGIDELEKMLNE